MEGLVVHAFFGPGGLREAVPRECLRAPKTKNPAALRRTREYVTEDVLSWLVRCVALTEVVTLPFGQARLKLAFTEHVADGWSLESKRLSGSYFPNAQLSSL